MSKVRPLSLTIIAWLFIIFGALSAWNLLWQLWQHQRSMNLGFLLIFLGRGLLKLQSTAYSWAIFVVFVGWLSLALAGISFFLYPIAVRFGHQELTGTPRLLVLIVVLSIYGGILAWMTRVLMKREVADLF